MPNIDKLTVTFYDEEEVAVAKKFRAMLKESGISINDKLKVMITNYTNSN